MADKKISEFSNLSTIGDNDVCLVNSNNATFKTTFGTIKNFIKASIPTGVKGSTESSYRTGQVNLTPANIGALSTQGGALSGNLSVTKQDGTTFITIKNAEYGGVETGLMIGNNGHHGIYTNGYWDGDKFVSDWKWILYRANNAELRTALPNATQSAAGLMSAEDKTKLGGIKEIKTMTVTVRNNTPASFIPISEVSGWVVNQDNFISCVLTDPDPNNRICDEKTVIVYINNNLLYARIKDQATMQDSQSALYTLKVKYLE